MDKFQQYAFVEFTVAEGASLERLQAVFAELQKQKKTTEPIRDEGYWLTYFLAADRAEFWWPSKTEMELWNKFWFSTPLPDRGSPEMPSPPWDFGSMIDSLLDGEFDLVGVRELGAGRARLEFDPHAYPYGGTGAARALVRAYGHKITGSDDGAGYTDGNPEPPRWNTEMVVYVSKNVKRPSFFDRFKRG